MHKVLIRPLEISDASISWKWRNDPEIWKYTGKKPDIFVTEEIEKKWLHEKLLEKDSVRFAITVDDLYVGNIQLTNIIKEDKAEYHIFIGERSFWGKGIASLATNQIIRYATNILKLKEISLFVNPLNKAAIKVYEKSGFRIANDQIEMKLSLKEQSIPTVSVFMMAYNHEKYISEAIEGVLMQKVKFDFDIVIGEDCSTDNTRKIILDYQAKYPGKFKLILHETNVGAFANQNFVLGSCTGKYIAMCEGDDYWTDPYKLQKQVDFLEANPDCSLCFHATEFIHNDVSKNFIHRPKKIQNDGKFTIKHAILGGGGFMATNSMMFSKVHITEQPTWIIGLPIGDLPLMLLLASKGKIGYIDEEMGVYRVTSSSESWSSSMQNYSKRRKHHYIILKMWNDFDKWTNQKYHRYVIRKKMKNRWSYFKSQIKYFITKLLIQS